MKTTSKELTKLLKENPLIPNECITKVIRLAKDLSTFKNKPINVILSELSGDSYLKYLLSKYK